MRNQQDTLTGAPHRPQAVQHHGFGRTIQGRGRLVQYQDRRILEKGASQRHTLALPTGEIAAPGPHLAVQDAVTVHELIQAGLLHSRPDALEIRSRSAELHVLHNRALDKVIVFGYKGDVLTQRAKSAVPDVGPPESNPSRIVHQPQKGLGDAGLPAAARSHQRDYLTRVDAHTRVPQDRLAFVDETYGIQRQRLRRAPDPDPASPAYDLAG